MSALLAADVFGHIVFDGTTPWNGSSTVRTMKLFLRPTRGAPAELRHVIAARDVGILDAVSLDPYGRDCKCPPGNYFVGAPQACATRDWNTGAVTTHNDDDAGYGCYFTPLYDMSPDGGMAEHGRGGIGNHGGGTALADPFALHQGWAATLGCLRMQNADNEQIYVPFVQAIRAASADPDRAIVQTIFWGARHG